MQVLESSRKVRTVVSGMELAWMHRACTVDGWVQLGHNQLLIVHTVSYPLLLVQDRLITQHSTHNAVAKTLILAHAALCPLWCPQSTAASAQTPHSKFQSCGSFLQYQFQESSTIHITYTYVRTQSSERTPTRCFEKIRTRLSPTSHRNF